MDKAIAKGLLHMILKDGVGSQSQMSFEFL